MITPLERLEICHEISALKYRYVRAVEERDWDLYADCLTEDVTHQTLPAPGSTELEVHSTRAGLRQWLPKALEKVHVQLRVSMPEFDIVAVDCAQADWAVVERLVPTGDGPLRELTYYGRYHETYRKGVDGCWRIASIAMSRIRHDTVYSDGRVEVGLDLAQGSAQS